MYFKQFKNAIFSELKANDAMAVKTYLQTKERYKYYVSKLDLFEKNSNEDFFNEIDYIKNTCLPSATDNYALAKIELDCLVYDIMEDIIVNNQSSEWFLFKKDNFKNENLTIENVNKINKFDFANLSKKLLLAIDSNHEVTKKRAKSLVDIYFIMLSVAAKNGSEGIEKLSRLEKKAEENFRNDSFLTELYFDFNYYSKGNGVLEKFLIEITNKNSSFNNLTDEDLIRFANSSHILAAKIDITENNDLNLKPEYIIKKCRINSNK